ncbi:MAG: nucleotidyltransferase domain-containing protein [Proteobacteria bacterium]|nr:nucleotidyltransferase domain-containing protein [Pseudomonadota bacterium]
MRKIEDYAFIRQLKVLPFVEAIWLFGSRARGTNAERSDIDLAIVCPKANKEEWLIVEYIIQEADTLLHIDCVRFDKLAEDDRLRQNILEQKKILYERSKR